MRYTPWKLVGKTLGLLSVLGVTGFFAFSSKPDLRIVAHLADSDPARIADSLESVESLMAAAAREQQRPDVAVIVTGAGVRGFRKASQHVLGLVERLQGAGVRFAIGEDALRRMKVQDHDLPVGFIVVPSASYEIAKLRKQHYEYLRP